MAHSATYSPDDLQDMGLHPVDLLIANASPQIVQPQNYAVRTDLITSLQNTNYENFAETFLTNGNNAFAVGGRLILKEHRSVSSLIIGDFCVTVNHYWQHQC